MLFVRVERLSGKSCELQATNSELITEVEGFDEVEGTLRFRIPESKPGKFINHQLTILLGSPALVHEKKSP